MAKRTVKEIIEDWVFSVWKEELPRTFQTRRDAYYRLFNTLAQEGYGWDDVSVHDEKYLKSFTVGKKGTGQQKAEWGEYADKHILDAKIHAFGTRGEIAQVRQKASPVQKLLDPYSVPKEVREAETEEPQPEQRRGRFKEYVPNPKNLEVIDKMFRFEFTDEDIGDGQ